MAYVQDCKTVILSLRVQRWQEDIRGHPSSLVVGHRRRTSASVIFRSRLRAWLRVLGVVQSAIERWPFSTRVH